MLQKILVIDDHPYLAKGMAGQLVHDAQHVRNQLDDQELVLEAHHFGNIAQAEKFLQKQTAQLIILDLDLGNGESELETLAACGAMKRRANCEAGLAIFSGLDFGSPRGLAILRDALNSPDDVRGVIPKTTKEARVIESISRLLSGEEWLPTELMKALAQPALAASQKDAALGLTNREWQVAELIAEGLPNKRIAVRLSISEQHTRQIVSMILSKLGLDNRVKVAIEVFKTKKGIKD